MKATNIKGRDRDGEDTLINKVVVMKVSGNLMLCKAKGNYFINQVD